MNLLGKNSYPEIVKEIFDKIQKAEAQTLTGNELLSEVYSKLNESKTPILDLHDFVTNAEKIAGDDATIKEIVDFVGKKVVDGDLNFIINLCKEEHFKNLSRTGHPSPEATIKDIESTFSDTASVIEMGIRSGLYDGLESKLLNKIKSDLNVKDKTPLNENSPMVFNGNIVQYSPVGIRFNDVENNRILLLTESCILSMDMLTKQMTNLNESEILDKIPASHKRMMEAINSLAYNPEESIFSLNEAWDFDLKLDKKGIITVNGKPIVAEKLRQLLFESVKEYAHNPLLVQNFNKMKFLHDADNLMILAENANLLIKFDNLETLKNLNENTFVVFEKKMLNNDNTSVPTILSSSNNEKNMLFENYGAFVNHTNSILNSNVVKLFESQLNFEMQNINIKTEKLAKLYEDQNSLNGKILEVRNLRKYADQDSPAMDKLNEQENMLSKALDETLKNINELI